MKHVWLILALLLCGSVFAQGQQSARATYARNGTLIGLADLAPLKDCSVRAMDGKVKTVKAEGAVVSFDLDSKSQRMRFQFPLTRLASSEQVSFQKDLLRKGLRLRASGYACKGPSDPLEPINIERAY